MPPLPGEAGGPAADDNSHPSLFQIMDEIERRIIVDMLERTNWNQTEAAERFMIPLSTLNQKIKRLGIDVRRRGRTDDSFTASSGKYMRAGIWQCAVHGVVYSYFTYS